MRVLSGDEIKKGQYKRTQALPREGSQIRAIYDFLKENAGREVTLSGPPYSLIRQLRDFYGCEIEIVRGKSYCLVGEWFGRTYVDYRENLDE